MTIVGIGAVTGYGRGRETLWHGLRSGKSAVTLQPGYGTGRDEHAWVALIPDGGDPLVSSSIYGGALQEAGREAIADASPRAGGGRAAPSACCTRRCSATWPTLLDGPTLFGGGITVKLSLGVGGNNSMAVLGSVD
ncbi:hypothetical protein ACQP0C_28550 [Nocardia sp. CA-129566]|uniref:hypothetical protein n=1 Tax=Nocardia sp. CA-129566 TaxID=3239976 RepID=UPI003D98C39E